MRVSYRARKFTLSSSDEDVDSRKQNLNRCNEIQSRKRDIHLVRCWDVLIIAIFQLKRVIHALHSLLNAQSQIGYVGGAEHSAEHTVGQKDVALQFAIGIVPVLGEAVKQQGVDGEEEKDVSNIYCTVKNYLDDVVHVDYNGSGVLDDRYSKSEGVIATAIG